jgi:NAD(P)-dependent dehydrogenase (short-subunit alcohol dehydrogenase family)
MPAEKILNGRVALVTGASRGLGRYFAQRLASAGATVVITARGLDKPVGRERDASAAPLAGTLRETEALIVKAGGKAVPLAADLEDPAQRNTLIERINATVGPVTILVNNAGFATLEPVEVMSLDVFDRTIDHYLRNSFVLSKACIPTMRAQGGGWIVNISSAAALPPPRPFAKIDPDKVRTDGAVSGGSVYGAVKAGLNRFTQGLAEELVNYNIAVNVVAPSTFVRTPGSEAYLPDAQAYPGEDPAYIAETVLAMCHKPAAERTGLVAYSMHFPHDEKLPVWSLDGTTRMPDLPPPDFSHKDIVPAGSGRAFD